MKLLIAGSRRIGIIGWDLVGRMMDFVSQHGMPSEIVSGNCKTGADYFGEKWAESNNIPVKLFPADWDQYGRAAGPIRNKEMAKYCDRAILFWDNNSRGTKNMIEELRKANKPYTVHYPNTVMSASWDGKTK